MSHRWLVAVVSVAGLLLVGDASGQGGLTPWSPPAQLPETTNGPTGLVFGADGRGVLIFDNDSTPELAVTDGLGSFSTRARFHLNEEVVPAVFGRDGVLLARWRGGDSVGQSVRLGVSIGDSSGRVGPFRRVARYRPALTSGGEVSVATTTDGAAVLGWIEALPKGRARVRIVERRAGRRFGKPRTIAAFRLARRQRVPQAQVAIGQSHAFVVAWAERRRRVVRARTGRISGRLGAIQTVGRHGLAHDPGRQLDVELAASGRHIVIAWFGADRPRDAADERGIVRVASASAPRWRFGASRRLGTARRRTNNKGRIGLALTRGDEVTVAWSERADDTSSVMLVRAALRGPAGDFTEPIDLGTGTVSNSAARSDGTTMITWAGGPPGTTVPQPQHVMAALHAPGQAGFEQAETVSGDEERIFRTVSGFSDRTGRPTIAWEALVPMGDPGATWMRFATRDAP